MLTGGVGVIIGIEAMRVERYFHIRPNYKNGGATVRVVGDTDTLYAGVKVQVSFCHPFSHKDLTNPETEEVVVRVAERDKKTGEPTGHIVEKKIVKKVRKGDVFNKAAGRDAAKLAEQVTIQLRDLPHLLQEVEAHAAKQVGYKWWKVGGKQSTASDFSYAVRPFLPR